MVEKHDHLVVELLKEFGSFIEAFAQKRIARLQALVFVSHSIDLFAEAIDGLDSGQELTAQVIALRLCLLKFVGHRLHGDLQLLVVAYGMSQTIHEFFVTT